MLFVKKIIVAFLVGVFILMISGCESNVPTQSVDEIGTLQKTIEGFNSLADEIPDRKPGQVDSNKLTDLIRDIIKASGRDPDKISFGDLSEKGYSLKGKEAWEKASSVLIRIPSFFHLQSSRRRQPKQDLLFLEFPPPPVSGSVTVQYLGVQVTTNYSGSWNATAVANTISSNINNHPSIKLSATVNGTSVIVTEKRNGCGYNGNSVYVSHSNGTHITVNNETFIMSGGTDETGCHEEVPLPPVTPDGPPTYINGSWGSVINTSCCIDYGWVDMWSYSWASQSLFYIDVIGISERDYIVINAGQDAGYNKASAIVGTTEYKDPLDDRSNWWQRGDHIFAFSSDPNDAFRVISSTFKVF